MFDRAKELVDAFYTKPLSDYRQVVWDVREKGGLDDNELAYIKRRVDPVDLELIARHTRLPREKAAAE